MTRAGKFIGDSGMASKNDLSKLGLRVRELRKGAKLTVNELAGKVGCSYKHMFNLEQGETRPSIELYVSLVRALDAGKVPLVD